jgi:hypothetical protein
MPAQLALVYENDEDAPTTLRATPTYGRTKPSYVEGRYSILRNYIASSHWYYERPERSYEAFEPMLELFVDLNRQDTDHDENLEQRFRSGVAKWQEETRFESSMTNAAINTNYQQIIGMGPAVLPFILRELRDNGGYWFWALRMISGEDPVPAESKGHIPQMTQIWLQWGRTKGYI